MNTTHFTVGHVHLKVRDIDRASGFYTKLLGLNVTERVGHYLFLSYGQRHHDIAINEVGAEAESPRDKDVGLYHFAIEVSSLSELKAFFRRLEKANVDVRPVDHGISKVLYFKDPDGNGIEVYVDTRSATGRSEWQGKSTELDIEAIPD